MISLDINNAYLYRQFGDNQKALRGAFDNFLINLRRHWFVVSQLLDQGQTVKAAEHLHQLKPALQRAGFTDLANEIGQYEMGIKLNLFGPDAAKVRYESLNEVMAIARSRVKTELDYM